MRGMNVAHDGTDSPSFARSGSSALWIDRIVCVTDQRWPTMRSGSSNRRQHASSQKHDICK